MSVSSRKGSSFRSNATATQRHGSVVSSTYEQDETINIPNSVLERRMSNVQNTGNGRVAASMPHLVGSSVTDSVYLIPPETNISKRKWLVALYCFLYFAAYISTASTFTQYIYKRVQNEMYPDIDVFNETSVCYTNKSDPNYEKQTLVQQRASHWNMYYTLASGIPAVFASFILGSSSDKFGRKFLFFLPLIGTLLRMGVCALGIYLDFKLIYFLVGFICEGFSGYMATMLQVSFTYVADITPPKGKKRSLGITLIELFNGIGISVVGFSTGYFIQNTGFFYPVVAGCALVVINIVVVMFLPESYPKENRDSDVSLCDTLQSTFSLFFGIGNKGHRWMYNILMITFLLTVFTAFGSSAVETLYVLDTPFCWSPEKLGYYSSGKNLLRYVVGMGLIKVLQMVMSDEAIGMVGCVSYAASFVIEGLAQNDTLMYINAVVGIVGPLTIPICRALMSKLTGPEQQGAIFSAIAAMESIINVGSSVAGNEIYSATIAFYRGFAFFVFAGVNFICLVLLGIYRFGSRRTFPVPLNIRT